MSVEENVHTTTVRGQYANWEFWRVCLLTQMREFEVDLERGDIVHAYKELSDIVTVAIDAMRHTGGDPWVEIVKRVQENASKTVKDRDLRFYEDKLAFEEKILAELRRKRHLCVPGCGLCGT